MSTENSQNPQNDDRLQLHLRLLAALDTGRLDDLECPKCRCPAVSVWFTHPANDVYRTWFLCVNCDFHSRVQNSEKSAFFLEDRVNTELEERDLKVLKQSLFKRPPRKMM